MSRGTAKSSVDLWTILKWFIIVSWRFFTGAHMNGKTYNDATWFLDASPRFKARRNAYTWWRRKARMKRASWRNSCFWTATLLTLGFVWSTSSMLVIFAGMSPFIAWLVFGRARSVLYTPVVGSHSDGSIRQHWVMKPKTRRALEMVRWPAGKRRRPGLATAGELQPSVHAIDIPAEYAGAIRAEVIQELEGEPPLELKLLMSPD